MKIIRIILWILGFGILIVALNQYFRLPDIQNNGQENPPFVWFFELCPAILCLCSATLLSIIKWKNVELKIISHVVSFIICLGVSLFYGLVLLAAEGISKASTPITDIQKYEKVLAEWKKDSSDIISHFPETIPADAQDVRFYSFPGCFQADSFILLGFQVSEEDFQEYKNQFSPMVTKIHSGEDWSRFLSIYNETERAEFSKDFIVMQFDKDPNALFEHDKMHGIAMNDTINEIIFWAEW